MPKIQYKNFNFRQPTLDLIAVCNQILRKYSDAGYDMTLRQLYYQLVSADLIPNKQKEYDRLGSIVNDARLAGLVDWSAIVDRTRSLKGLAHWASPESILDAVASQYKIDKWKDQRHRIEVWIEKDALSGVFERICVELDVPYFSCRGYTSQSEMWSAAMRLESYRQNGQEPVILHFGDHDPSGIDMSRDIFDRLDLFSEVPVQVKRLALNMNQVEKYNPPPNPAKITDSRATSYIQEFGGESWELDALPPEILSEIVRKNVMELLDEEIWQDSLDRENHQKRILEQISERFDDVEAFFEDGTEE